MYEYYNYDTEDEIKKKVEEERKRKEAEMKEKKKATRRKLAGSIGFGLLFGACAAIAFQGINYANDRFFTKGKAEAAVPAQESPAKEPAKEIAQVEKLLQSNVPAASMSVADVAASTMPSIVSITNMSVQEVQMFFGMGTRQYETQSCGSGFIIGQNDNELLIVTNNHVVEGAKTLSVGFVDDEVYEATIKGTDARHDLAVIAVKLEDIDDDTMETIKIAKLGDSDDVVIGEQVVAIGNALGYGQSVTTGIVSALDRTLESQNIDGTLIQTDAAINPGNSGGALMNMKGEVIGINSAKLASTTVEGIGYAIPISSANPIIQKLMIKETREQVKEEERGYLGISGKFTVDADDAAQFGIPEGIFVSEVTKGSPAEKAGIIKGDVIREVDGESVTDIRQLRNMLSYYRVGEKVEVVIARADAGEYKERTVTVTLGSSEEAGITDASNDSEATTEEEEEQEDVYEIDPNTQDLEDLFRFFGY